MASKKIQYTSTSNSEQTICEFDVPTERLVECEIHQITPNNTIVSHVSITHDGINSFETQTSFSGSNTQPDEFTTSISSNTGYIKTVPSVHPTEYMINFHSVEANVFAEHTQPGRIIKGSNGYGITYANTTMYYVERSANNTEYLSTNSVTQFGPTLSSIELVNIDDLTPYNNSILTHNNDYNIVSSSGQAKNCQYLEIDVVPNQQYKFSVNAYYTFGKVYAKDTISTQHIKPLINIGYSINGGEIFDEFVIEGTETNYEIVFTPTSNTIYISFGQGALGTDVYFKDVSLKRQFPFEPYDQVKGTFYYNWDAVSSSTVLFTASDNTIEIDGSNNITINNINCGAQGITNKLALTFDEENIIFSLNGSIVLANTGFVNNVSILEFITTPNEFSYTDKIVSNTTLVELTND